MSDDVRLVTVTADNVDRERFFCYKSKPKSEGFRRKHDWLMARFAEGLVIKMIYEGKRSIAFIEYMPGENCCRAIDAPDYMVIHCLWVVGKGKGKGYARRLIAACEQDARDRGMAGVAVVSSESHWLCSKGVFLKQGFEELAQTAPSFGLLAKRYAEDTPWPTWPEDWAARAARYPEGATMLYVDQCPYMPDVLSISKAALEERGLSVESIRMESAEQIRELAPAPNGVFGLIINGELFGTYYLDKKEIRRLDAWLSER